MIKNVEILAYISQNPGSYSRNVSDFFKIEITRATVTLRRWYKFGVMRRLYEPGKGITYYITKWGQRYLNDQWANKMGDTPISNYYDSGGGGLKQDAVSVLGLSKRKKEAPLRDEEGRLFYKADLDKREHGQVVFVTQFNLYEKTTWSDISDWILGHYGPGEYFVSYSDKVKKVDVK